MAVKISNDAGSTLTNAINDSVTSILVDDASTFPDISGGHHCYATMEGLNGVEVVKCTTITGNTLTVERSQDDTPALAFSAGDTIDLFLNNAFLNDLQAQEVSGPATSTDNAVPRFDGVDGNVIQDSGVTIDDSDNLTTPAKVTAATVQLSGGDGDAGTFSWNADEETADLVLGAATLQLGQEIHVHVRNASGVEIVDGEAVMATGTIGMSGRITVAKSVADGSIDGRFMLGVATETIANGADGKITHFGKVRGVDTSDWDEGDVLWFDAATPGALTSTEPDAPNLRMAVAFVVTDHASSGALMVRVPSVNDLNDDQRVQISSIADGDFLQWVNSNLRWQNTAGPVITTASNVGGATEVFKQKAGNDLEFRTFDVDWAVVDGDTLTQTAAQHAMEHLPNGFLTDTTTLVVTSNGSTVTATLDNLDSPGTNIEAWFSDHAHAVVLSASAPLTPGSDTSPTLNYIYILASNDTLTVSDVGWPGEEHAKLGTVLCQSAATVQSEGAYKVHKWSDQPTGALDCGHLVHVNEWIRNQPATWKDGVAVTVTGSGTATMTVATASGNVYQLHEHAFPAFGGPSDFFVVNDSGTAFIKRAALSAITADSTGASITNRTIGCVLWGCVSEDSGDCKLFINLPGGSYGNAKPEDVREDANRYTDFSIPDDFKGTGFLIRRLVFGLTGGNYTLFDDTSDDLRGFSPNTAPGGSAGTSVEFTDNTFRIQDDGDNTKEIAFQASGITTGNTRTITMGDADVTLATATDAIEGLSEKSTDAEAVAGSADRVITPANLIAKMAAPGPIGSGTRSSAAVTTIVAAGTTAITGLSTFTASGAWAAVFGTDTASQVRLSDTTIAAYSDNASTPADLTVGIGGVNVIISQVDINSGAIDGVAIGASSPATEATVDNLKIDGNTISAISGAINITPEAGSAIVLDGAISVDGDVVTGAGSITSTSFVGALTGNASTATSATTSASATTVSGATQAAITSAANLATVGALNAGSITSGFGNINIGASSIDTTGAVSVGTFTSTGVDDNASAESINIDSNGAVTMPLTPAFFAYNSASDTTATGDGTVVTVELDTEVFDQGGDFTANTLTAPVTGCYPLNALATVESIGAGHTSMELNIVTSNRSSRRWINPFAVAGAGNVLGLDMSVVADMDANDTATVTVTVTGDTKTVGITGSGAAMFTFFSGFLAC